MGANYQIGLKNAIKVILPLFLMQSMLKFVIIIIIGCFYYYMKILINLDTKKLKQIKQCIKE